MPDFSEINPVSAVSSGLQFLGGLGQTLFSGVKKANRNLENFSKTYTPNQSISDYYNKAMANYNPNPYNSLSYQNAANKVQGNLATGISASQDRRGGLGSIGSLVNNANQADANAAASADAAGRANLNILGQAAGMKTREDKVPFDLQYNLLAMKAGAAAKTKSDGLQNMFGGLSSGASQFGKEVDGQKQYKYNMPYQAPNAGYYQQNGMGTPKDEQLPY